MTTQLDLLQIHWCDDCMANLATSDFSPGDTFTADDLRRWLTPPAHANWWGVLMAKLARHPRFENTNTYVKSARPEANGRKVPVWRVK